MNNQKQYRRILSGIKELGEQVVAKHAGDVDKHARFPIEAFESLKAEGLLGAYIPEEYGGMGLSMNQLGEMIFELGHYCSSTAMIFAMHNIMVASVVHHHQSSDYFVKLMRRVCDKQLLLASGHSEVGTGGDQSRSICHLDVVESEFNLDKQAPVISYGEQADAILVSCKRHQNAEERDQVQIVIERDNYSLDKRSDWDSLGMRGTCSCGYNLSACGATDQVFPVPYSDILKTSMSPASHVLWAYLWWGIADQAFQNAQSVVKVQHAHGSGAALVSRVRLSEINNLLFSLGNTVSKVSEEYCLKLSLNNTAEFDDVEFAARVNSLKVDSSEKAVEVVTKALNICGIAGYMNDSKVSVGRYIRDIYSAPLMINNDRIISSNENLLVLND